MGDELQVKERGERKPFIPLFESSGVTEALERMSSFPSIDVPLISLLDCL